MDGGDALHRWAFEKRRQVEIAPGLKVWLAPPEYLIIRKLEFYRKGGSQKHIEDIVKMWPQIKDTLNVGFLDSEIQARNLNVYWDQVRKDLDR